jgi:hypothetical protein
MARKFYGRKVFEAIADGRKFSFTCFGQDTSYGFRHVCFRGDEYFPQGENPISKACYYNRTWECFQYETVLIEAIEKLQEPKEVKDELYNKLIVQRREDGARQVEEEVKAFEKLFNSLSDTSKEIVRTKTPLIQSEEQLEAVKAGMKFLQAIDIVQGLTKAD